MTDRPEPPPGSRLIDGTGHVFIRGDEWWTCACDDHKINLGWDVVRADAIRGYRIEEDA